MGVIGDVKPIAVMRQPLDHVVASGGYMGGSSSIFNSKLCRRNPVRPAPLIKLLWFQQHESRWVPDTAMKRPSVIIRARRISSEAAQLESPIKVSVASRKKPSLQPAPQSTDDLDLDYKEAAVVLEHLFIESPSLDESGKMNNDRVPDNIGSAGDSPPPPPTSVGSPPRALKSASLRRRKDLTMRISLRRKRLESRRGVDDRGGTDLLDTIWSGAVSQLLRQHGDAVNLMAQNWSKLGRQLLTVEEERWLASLMKPFKTLKRIKASLKQQLGREPTDEEWAQVAKLDVATLTRHTAVHQAARNKLVKLNLRLVMHQARKYHREAITSSLSVLDLCQEGVKGLIVAVERFDPNKGFRFSTYAIFWIRNSILRAQTRSGYPIRSPFNFAELKMNIKKIKWELRLEAGEAQVGDGGMMRMMLERAGVDEDRYKVVMRSSRRIISLHKRDRVTGAELIEQLADRNATPHDATTGYFVGGGGGADPTLRLGIDDVLDSLKPKESLVLRQRFGLDGKGERALGEIGRNMRISREMVRRYEARGLLKLKHPTRLAYLRSFLCHDS